MVEEDPPEEPEPLPRFAVDLVEDETRLVADRMAEAPREAFRPPLELPLELATLPAESPVAPVLAAAPEDEEPELKLATLPPDELPPPEEVDPPPVVARVELLKERLSRPYPLRLPRSS